MESSGIQAGVDLFGEPLRLLILWFDPLAEQSAEPSQHLHNNLLGECADMHALPSPPVEALHLICQHDAYHRKPSGSGTSKG